MVVVDNFAKPHLMATDATELHFAAARLGITRDQAKSWRVLFYEVTAAQRAKAVLNGARIVNASELLRLVNAGRLARGGGR